MPTASGGSPALPVHRYKILDTPRETEFDRMVVLAAKIFEVPVAVISFIEGGRQWFKAEVGLGVESTDIGCSICRHAVAVQNEVFLIRDARLDARTEENPLVTGPPHIRFYAGAPLVTPEGDAIGTICVVDFVPRQFGRTQSELLATMGKQVMTMLESRLNRLKQEGWD